MSSDLRRRIVAFRMAAHHLSVPPAEPALQSSAAIAGMQTSRVDSAAVAFAIRDAAIIPDDLTRALTSERSLITTWAMRGAPYVVPARELAVFTTGAAPDPVLSITEFASGWVEHLHAHGVDFDKLIGDIVAAAREELRGGPLPVDDLRTRIYATLTQLHSIERPQFSRADMPEALYRLLGPLGIVCIVEGEGSQAVIGALDGWVRDTAPPSLKPHAAKVELLRRFLHAYGPASERMFAEWTARSRREVDALFDDLGEELERIDDHRHRGWMLARDVDTMRDPPDPDGLWLLPPLDPFLAQRDRATLIPDRALADHVWKPLGPPGAVLRDGQVVGVWRSTRKARRLVVTVEPFVRVTRSTLNATETAADRIAPFRGAADATVEVVER
jgi:Winged helix DNA-binding domain